jgi:hypothetical protein
MESIIYKIVNLETGDIYIGSAVYGKKRWYTHKCLLKKGKHHSIILQREWNKYGENNFVFQTLETVDVICKIAGKFGRLGIKHTDESIKKMRSATLGNTSRKGKKCSVESKERMKISNKGKGHPHSIEFINRLKTIKCKPITQYSIDNIFIKEWPSIKEASSTLKIGRTSISFAVSGKYKTAGGFVWSRNENKQKI